MLERIDIYNDSKIVLYSKTPKSIISWITILIIMLILFIIFMFIPFNIYKNYKGYISLQNNETYINLIVDEYDFPIYKNKKLYIKNDKYDYDIISLDNNVLIKINLKDELKIENNIVLVNVLSERTTVFEMLKNKIKKGLDI